MPDGALLCAIPARAQGMQTAVLTGTATSADGVALPGVTVTASSPALLGDRTEVTDVNGVYAIKGLPAGTYSVTFDLDELQAGAARATWSSPSAARSK